MTAAMHTRDAQRVHATGNCYSLTCSCGPDDRPQSVELRRAYAYVRAHLLVCMSEVNRTRERLSAFAATSGLDLAAIFVEDGTRSAAAFGRLLDAVVRDQVEVVLLPSMLHLMTLGSPRCIRTYFEVATGAQVLALP
ncbi:hypothetical protein AB0L64_06025 [Kribbella sp. NPDC051936]|uniref:hypothetical protein n=1 Tax=Kribbella sp. NPDC051936 TaxID=3154946 RepID=UPI0034478C2E